MIPNDRPRSSLGSPGDFGQQNPKSSMKNPNFLEKTDRKQIQTNHDFSKDFDTNGWGPNGGGPFVPVRKKWPLAYQPEERKRRSMSDLVGKLYELDRLEFSFPPAGVFQTAERRSQ